MQLQPMRIVALLLPAALLTGCAGQADAVPSLSETQHVTERTTLPETTECSTSVTTEQTTDETLCVNEYSIYGSRRTTYRQEEGELVPIQLAEQYWQHSSTVTDTYEFAQDGQKILVQREIKKTDGSRSEIIEYPMYFRILPDTVQVLQNAQIVQELPVGSFWDGYTALEAFYAQQEITPTVPLDGAHLREPEQYLGTEDYDFDGYADLYVPDSLYRTWNGTYYRFSPENGHFVLWDALNVLGYPLDPEPELGILNSYQDGQHRKWQWQNEQLIEIETEP